MKLIKAAAHQNLIKQTTPRKYEYFIQLMFLACLFFIETASGSISYNPDDFGTSKSEPIDSGFFFYGGKYIDAPYIVARRGLEVYINDILVRRGPISELYDYSVDTDPGEPPQGTSPFDPAPEGADRRDNYYSKKWRYLYTHNDYETAKKMMFEIYKKCTELDDVHWSASSTINVVNKKTGMVIGISLGLQNGGAALKQPNKNDLIEKMEKIKKSYEKLLQDNLTSFEIEGFSATSGGSQALEAIKILLYDINDSEKFKILDEKGLIPGCKEELPWIVTDFEASSQLKERIESLEKKYIAKKVAQETSYILDSTLIAPTLEKDTMINLPKEAPVSIGQADNSPNNLSPAINDIKNIAQIDDTSYNSKRIIFFLSLTIGIISLSILHIYRSRHIKSGKEGD